MQVVSKYEVECPSCRVKYPPGQKKCVHCGGRTAQSIVEVPDAPPEFTEAVGREVRAEPEPLQLGDGREIVFLPDGAGEEEEASGGWLKRLGGLVWLVLFVVLTAVRMCTEGE